MYDFYDNMPFGVMILGGNDLSIKYVNSIFIDIFNIEGEALNKNLVDIKYLYNIKDILKTCFESKINKKFKKVNASGERYADLTINVEEELIQIYSYEVTEYINRETKMKKDNENLLKIWSEIKTKCDILQQLRTKEKEYIIQLKNTVNNMSEGLIVLDEYGKFDFYNIAASEIINFDLKKISTYSEFFRKIDECSFNTNEQYIEDLYRESLKNFKPINNFIVKIRDENKKDFKYIELNCRPVVNNNILISTIITINDITEIKSNEIKLEKQAIELEKASKDKDEFFNMISHELRTPLTIIHSSIQLAKDIYKSEISTNIEKILFRVNQNCRVLLRLINNILDISKAEAGFLNVNSSVFDIVVVTESLVNSVSFYAKSRGIDLIFDTTEEGALISLDKDKYEKIILNLLSNAIKFTPRHKSIIVTTDIKEKIIEIRVKDEGVGIAQEKVGKIFDRFVQVENSLSSGSNGTGLGLSLVKRFVELMDGNINVRSKLGEGTEFIITFNILNKNLHSMKETFELDSNINNKVLLEFSNITEENA